MPDVEDKNFSQELREGLKLYLAGFPLSLEQELEAQKQISMEKFLDHKILFYNGKTYTTRQVLEFFANKAGGTHYAADLPKDFAELISFGVFDQPVLVNALYQVGAITYELGLRLLRRLADFEMHLLILVPPQDLKEPAYVFDSKYPDSAMRIFYRFDPGLKPRFGVTSIQNIHAEVGSDRLIDWKKPHH